MLRCVSVILFIFKFQARKTGAFQSTGVAVSRTANVRLHYAINIAGWFSKSKGDGDKKTTDDGNLEGVPQIMDSMDNFKQVQKVGKITGALAQELASTTVEGIGADGKIKVTYNCQQKPMGVSIDEDYLKGADVLDVKNALMTAMKDAHSKSTARMDERMKSFYSDLGLGSS